MHLSKRNFPARVDYCFMSLTTMHWYPIIECIDATTTRRRSWSCASSSPPWKPSTSSPMLTQSRSPSTLSSTVWFSFELPTAEWEANTLMNIEAVSSMMVHCGVRRPILL